MANQRGGQSVRMASIVKTEPPLDTESILIRWPFAPVDSDNLALMEGIACLAANAAIRTERINLFLCRPDQNLRVIELRCGH